MTSKNKHLQRYTWEDAVIEAEATGNLSKGAANFALRISRAINWSPEDKDRPEPGLYWANELAAQAVGVSVRSYYDNAPVLTEAGFWKTVGGNHVPTLPPNHKDVHRQYEERTKALTAKYNADKQAKEEAKEAKKAAKATAKLAAQTAKLAVPTAKSAPATAKVAVPTANLAGYLVKTLFPVDPFSDDVFTDDQFLALADAPAIPSDRREQNISIITLDDLAASGGVTTFSYFLKNDEPSLSGKNRGGAYQESVRDSATANFAVGSELTLRQRMLMTEEERKKRWSQPVMAGADDGDEWL